MAPRAGGETDKYGNKYELAWAIRHALYCIRDDRRTLTLEDADPELAQGSEFTYATHVVTEVHQLKRQNGNSNSWTVKALSDLKIFEAAARHVAAGRHFHFVSLVPCRPLQELADRARRSTDLTAFTQSWLTDELRTVFDQLSAAPILATAQNAWDTLRGMWFSIQDEDDVVQVNDMLAELTLTGATGRLMSLAIGELLLGNLGAPMKRLDLLAKLTEVGIAPLPTGSSDTAHMQLVLTSNSWRESVQRALLEPVIERAEIGSVLEGFRFNRVGLVVGTAGGGKSSVLEQVVTSLQSSGAEVLALRLDRLDPFASTINLGEQLGFTTSPAATLGVAADGRDAYLVIDQVDAVSLASGRMPESFDVVMDLIDEAMSVGNVRILLACREFDVDNDHRIRALASRGDVFNVEVGALDDATISSAVEAMGLAPARITPSQRKLLATPLHLVLLNTIADQDDALAFQSRGSLFEAFWDRKRQSARARREGVRFNDVISLVANAASDRQVLSVPIELLDQGDLIEDANVLVSENVLVRDGDRIAFFHETFFDYAFARHWITRSESIVDFLLRDEQELFRRAQVRQILQHLHQREPDRFLAELESLLEHADIRFHIKATALAVFGNLQAPGTAEVELALRLAVAVPTLAPHLWHQLRQPQWFRAFDKDGHIASWLSSEDVDAKTLALDLMVSGSRQHGDDVAVLLAAQADKPEYLEWIRRIVRFAHVHEQRELFDLMLDATRQGAFDDSGHELWHSARDLAQRQPMWAIELLQVRLVDRDDSLTLDQGGKVAALGVRDYSAAELVRDAAALEPEAFLATVVPYLLKVMKATEYRPTDAGPLLDQHFHVRIAEHDVGDRDLDNALFDSTARAIERLATSDPEGVRATLQVLADDPHEAAQFLLFRGLIVAGPALADWAAALLLEGGERLECGYISDGDWVSREVVKSISPHTSDKLHKRLEALFRDLRNPYEQPARSGWTAFTFLSALAEARLTATGKGRLEELRRKFSAQEPVAPRGMVVGTVVSPIGDEAATKMTDSQWLRAMAKYNADDHDWDTLRGGARELSQQLQRRVAEDPLRFARLALRMTPEMHAAYATGVLMGFADGTVAVNDPEPIFEAIRHLAAFGKSGIDNWLGHSLRRFFKSAPLDIVAIVLDRALNSPDPADNAPVVTRSGGDPRRADDLRMNGINVARGSLAESLGDLLVNDVDGERTKLVRPYLDQLASDPVLSVRSCVAHTIAASLRHARPAAYGAFERLIDTDDLILATQLVQQLMLYIGNVDPQVIDPVIQRMLASTDVETREAGGLIAAFAALEWQRAPLMEQAMALDEHVRRGIAHLCASRLDRTSNAELAASTLVPLFNDPDDGVREAAADVAGSLRGQPLRPYASTLEALIASPGYVHASPQVFFTLQEAPDKVDDLALLTSQKFVEVSGSEAGDMRTSAAGDAHYVSELVVRGLAQSSDRTHRSALLDVLDLLLWHGVYGIGEAIAEFERF